MHRLAQISLVVIAACLVLALLGIVGVFDKAWRSYCFIAAPILLVIFVWLKRKAGKDSDFKDTPWGL